MDGGGVTVEGTTSLAVDDDEDKDKVDKLVGIVARAASHLVIPPPLYQSLVQQRQGDFLSNPSLIPPLRQAELELFCKIDKVKLKHEHYSNLQAESFSTKALLSLHRGQKHLEAHCVVGTKTGKNWDFAANVLFLLESTSCRIERYFVLVTRFSCIKLWRVGLHSLQPSQ